MADIDVPQLLVNLRNAAIFTEKFRGPNLEAIHQAIALIERLTKQIELSSDEWFVVRALRTSAERTDNVLIMSNDGERIGLKECGSYAAKPGSKAVLTLLDRLEKGAANG